MILTLKSYEEPYPRALLQLRTRGQFYHPFPPLLALFSSAINFSNTECDCFSIGQVRAGVRDLKKAESLGLAVPAEGYGKVQLVKFDVTGSVDEILAAIGALADRTNICRNGFGVCIQGPLSVSKLALACMTVSSQVLW